MAAGGRIQVQHREEAVGRVRRELLPRLDDLRSIRPRPLERVRRDLADRVRAEEEARDDSEVAAAPTAERPVEIGVLPGVGHDRRSVREDDRRLEQVVARQPVLPRGQAHAPAEREPCDPHGRTGAGGNRAPVLPEPVVDVDETRTGPDDRPTRRVERDTVQPGDVDDHAGRRGVAAVAVAARARNDPDAVLASPADGSLHVGQRLAEDDGLRLVRVEAGVVQDARLVVRSIAANDHGATNQLRELVEDPARRRPRKVGQPTGERHRARRRGPRTCRRGRAALGA